MPHFGTKGSQVQILSPRLKAAELLIKGEQSAAAFFSAPEGRRKAARRRRCFAAAAVSERPESPEDGALDESATTWLDIHGVRSLALGTPRLYGSGGAADGNGGEDRAGDVAIEGAVLQLTTAIFDEIGLPSSAGVATSKVVAKVASALAKPRGVMLVPAGVERAVLAPLPVRSFPGIGPVAEAKLHAAGYETLGAVAEASVADLQKIFGVWACESRRGVQGLGSGDVGRERPAFAEHDPEGETVGSISNERTFREDVTDPRSRVRTPRWRPTRSSSYPIVKEMFMAARTRSLPIRLLGMQALEPGRVRATPRSSIATIGSAPPSTVFARASASRRSRWRPGADELVTHPRRFCLKKSMVRFQARSAAALS